MTNIIPFSFKGHALSALNRNGEAWFIGNEVAAALGYKDTDYAVRTHCKAAVICKPGELSGLGISCNSPRGMTIIPERDLYRLVMRSRLPSAEAFEEKVVGEILPTIRRTGSWGEPVTPMPPRLTARQVREAVGMLRSFTYVNRITGMEKNQALLAANRRIQENTGINLLQQTGATHLLANDTDHLLTPTAIGIQQTSHGRHRCTPHRHYRTSCRTQKRSNSS